MKKSLLVAAAAAMTLTSGLAAAQPYGHAYGHYEHKHDQREYRDSDRDGISDAREWNRDRDGDGRPDQYDRYDNRMSSAYDSGYRARSYGYAQPGYAQPGYGDSRYSRGERYPYYNQRQYVLDDYRAYDLPAPRSGYQYYRSDNGDVVMAAIASGIIGLVIGGALSNNNHRDGYRYYGR